MKFTFTVFNTKKPLSKKFNLDAEGALVKTSGGTMVQGTGQTLEIDFPELPDILSCLPGSAVAWGVAREYQGAGEVYSVTTKDATKQPDTIARTRENYVWPSPAIMLFDYDPPDGVTPWTPEEFREKLLEIYPEMDGAPMLVWHSASGHIYHQETGEQLKGPGGLHAYLLVSNGAEIPRAGEVLYKRAWLAGEGRVDLSRSGAMLARTFIDAAVWQPERLDFAAGAVCEGPLEQRLPAGVLYNSAGEPFDLGEIKPLSKAERAHFAQLVSASKAKAAPRANEQRERWVKERAEADISSTPIEGETAKARKERVKKVEKKYRVATENKRLFGDFPIFLENGEETTVRDILAAPKQWHGKKCCDPLEPDYREDKRIAMIVCNREEARIHSFAHGEHDYQLLAAEIGEPSTCAICGARGKTGEQGDILASNGRPHKCDPKKRLQHNMANLPGHDKGGKRNLVVWPGQKSELTDLCENLLVSSIAGQERIFQHNGGVIRLRSEKDADTGKVYQKIEPISAKALTEIFSRHINFKAPTKKGEIVPVDTPDIIAEFYLARGEWKLPRLSSTIYAPTMRKDFSVISRVGYDPDSELFLDGPEFDLPRDISIEDAQSAGEFLLSLVQDFPFVDPLDKDGKPYCDAGGEVKGISKSVWLANVLTIQTRHLYRSAPGFAYTAPVAGSGKTYLADLAALVATGKEAKKISQGRKPEETQKQMAASLLCFPGGAFCIDNIELNLANDSLCTILSEPVWYARVLGESRLVALPTKSTWSVTGNNLVIGGDLARRSLLCKLDPQCENPDEREFPRNLRAELRENWQDYCKAGLTILAGYIAAGRPKQQIKSFGSFEEWSSLVRSAIVWAGIDGTTDPCFSRAAIKAGDPIKANLGGLLESLYDYYGEKPFTVKEISGFSEETDEKKIAIANLVEEISGGKPRSLGKFLSKHAGRIVSRCKLVKVGTAKHAVKWTVERA
jgi:hypothetical protein